ncbi:MAG TPA: hypothetical protein VFQ81_09210 [Candidatus Limnocylindria bacterium]|nr:hypothetical protein [Candidatus Limnocylindria bacterium]
MKPIKRFPLAVVFLLAACSSVLPGGSAPRDDPVLTVQPDAAADGVLVTIGAALDDPGHPAFVGGMLLVDAAGTAWLCEALAESFPPQCAGERVRVENLGVVALPRLATGGGVQWSNEPIQLLGTVQVP